MRQKSVENQIYRCVYNKQEMKIANPAVKMFGKR